MKPRRWLVLPFWESSGEGREDKRGSQPIARPEGGDGGIDAIPRHERIADFANKSEEDTVEDFNAPIHWWVVCTLFPLIAGTFGPIASAFNICAVAIDWRTMVSESSDESEGAHITDPTWLVAVNAVSLAIAIIGNIVLLMQMSGRIRFSFASPVTIICWYVSGFLDIALVAAAHTQLPLPAGVIATYSQAFYYACFSGALYVLMAVLLSFTAAGVWVYHFTTEFKLSTSQRSLMLQTIMYLGYLLCAAAVYSYIEGWDYLDAVYYVNVTLFTIGFGDFSPETHLGRALLFPMAIGGILFVGLIIADIRSLVLESGSRKINTRVVEKARYKALLEGDPKNGVIKLRGFQPRKIDGATELERRAQEFQIMRDIQARAAKDNRFISLVVSGGLFFLLWLIGAVIFWQAESAVGGENWTYFESLYFVYVSLLTIGYGDFYPQTNSAKPTFVFWSLIALPTLTVLIGSIGDAVADFVNSSIGFLGKHTVRLTEAYKDFKARARKDGTRRAVQLAEAAREDHSFEDQSRAEALQAVNRNVFSQDSTMQTDPRTQAVAEQAAEYAYRPFLVIQEIKKIVDDLDQSPAKKYNFVEWTKFLKLLDEDESSPEGHRVPGHPHDAHLERGAPMREHKNQAWSWMGQESPLMSNEDEPKWLLTRLIAVLEMELKARGDKRVLLHVEKEERVANKG